MDDWYRGEDLVSMREIDDIYDRYKKYWYRIFAEGEFSEPPAELKLAVVNTEIMDMVEFIMEE